jgi:hypothetical protein
MGRNGSGRKRLWPHGGTASNELINPQNPESGGTVSRLLLLFNWTANGFLPGGSGTTIRHITQNTPHSKKHRNKTTNNKQKEIPWPESASELYLPIDLCLSAKLVPTFADRECHVVSVTDPYGRILGFLDRSRYFFFQVDPQLYSRRWVDPVPDPPLPRKSGSTGNRTRFSGSVARSSDH